MLHQALKSSDENLTAAFVGEFDSGAKELLRQVCDPVILSDARGLIGVYDRMDDPEFPHIWSKTKMRELSGACHKVIFLANGTVKPDLPSGVTCIGYKPGVPDTHASEVYWGLKYAPFNRDVAWDDPLSAAMVIRYSLHLGVVQR